MSVTTSNPVSVGFATKKTQWDALWDNFAALKAVGIRIPLGGSPTKIVAVAVGAIAIIPDGIRCRLSDCAAIQGMTMEVHFMGHVSSGTGYARLYNATDAAYIGSAYSFTDTSDTLQIITSLTIPATGQKDFELHAYYGAAANAPHVWGASLVLR